jgi:hypothetical protein
MASHAGDLIVTDLGFRSGATFAADATSGSNPPGKLWIPIWSGEVINAYDQYNRFESMVETRTIQSGTTMEFPITGTVSLKPSWGAGEELLGGDDTTATTFQVKLDARPMAAHFELDNIDLMITQWEYRSELARQAGLTLANARDRQISAYIARAAAEEKIANDPRVSGGLVPKAPFTSFKYADLGDAGGDDAETDAALLLLKNIEDWMVYLQETDISTEGVYCAVDPPTFASIRALGVARDNADLGYGSATGSTDPMFAGIAQEGGLGSSLAARPHIEEMLTYMGCTIIKSNHLPNKDYAVGEIGEARYNLNFVGTPGAVGTARHCKALMWQQGCVAGLKLQGLKVDTVDDIRRNTTFTVASVMGGTGVLAPERAVAVINSLSIETTDSLHATASTRAELKTAWGMTGEWIEA